MGCSTPYRKVERWVRSLDICLNQCTIQDLLKNLPGPQESIWMVSSFVFITSSGAKYGGEMCVRNMDMGDREENGANLQFR